MTKTTRFACCPLTSTHTHTHIRPTRTAPVRGAGWRFRCQALDREDLTGPATKTNAGMAGAVHDPPWAGRCGFRAKPSRLCEEALLELGARDPVVRGDVAEYGRQSTDP